MLRLADLELATKTNPNLSPCKNAFFEPAKPERRKGSSADVTRRAYRATELNVIVAIVATGSAKKKLAGAFSFHAKSEWLRLHAHVTLR